VKNKEYENFILLKKSIAENAQNQYLPHQRQIRLKRSQKKFLSKDEKSKIRRKEIALDLKELSRNLNYEKNVLSVGCRNLYEINFLSGINKNFNVKGIDLAPNDSSNIIQGNVENFLDIKGNKISPFGVNNIDIVYSSHNLEHLSQPMQHFEKLLEISGNELLCYYILPCWNGTSGPTNDHPNYIHCTHSWELFTNENMHAYLKEVLPANTNVEVIFTRYKMSICDDLRCAFRVTKHRQS